MNKLDLNSLKWRKKPLEKKKKTYSTQCVMKSLTLPNKTLLKSLMLIMLLLMIRRAKRKKKKLKRSMYQQSPSNKSLMRFGHNLETHIHYQKKRSWKKLLLKKLLKKCQLLLKQNLLLNNQSRSLRFIPQLWHLMKPQMRFGLNSITQHQWLKKNNQCSWKCLLRRAKLHLRKLKKLLQ